MMRTRMMMRTKMQKIAHLHPLQLLLCRHYSHLQCRSGESAGGDSKSEGLLRGVMGVRGRELLPGAHCAFRFVGLMPAPPRKMYVLPQSTNCRVPN